MLLSQCVVIIITFGLCYSTSYRSSSFLVTAPKHLLADSKEKICVSIHDRRTVTRLSVTLYSPNSDNIIASTEDYVKGNASCLTIYIPPTDETEGKLQLRYPIYGDEVPYLTERNVEIKQDPLITIVAIEKPFYRPGEVVRFRILCLTHKLKVYKTKLQRVWIESPNGIALEQWLDIKTDLGLTQLEFSISEESLLGDWKIKVQHVNKNDFIESKTFTVKEYVLPWFEVSVKQPNEILADAQAINFEICAKYSYGAPVSGDVKLELRVKPKFQNLNPKHPNPKIIYEAILDAWTGCSVLNVTGAELFLSDPSIQPEAVIVTAIVTETASKKSERAITTIDVSDSAIRLQFHCSEYFKPGLPYKGKLRALSAGGHPTVAVDLPVQICMKEGAVYGTIRKQCWNYSTDYSSEVIFTLPPRPNSTDLISLTAVSLNHPNKYYDSERWRLLMVQPKAKQDLKPWFSPSKSYIDVSTNSPVVCNTEHSLHVQYTVSSFNSTTPTFYYVVESRGDLLRIGYIKPDVERELVGKVLVGFPPARTFILRLVITPDMAPESRIVVYYIRRDNEVIAASTMLSIDKCFPNKVRVRWSEKEVQPGTNVSLSVRAHPSSFCAISVIDSMLAKGNYGKIFTSDTIWEKLEYYKSPFITDNTDYCKLPTVTDTFPMPDNGEDGVFDNDDLRRKRGTRAKRMYLLPSIYEHVDAIRAFNDIGVVVLTDSTLETRPCPNDSIINSYFPLSILRSMPVEQIIYRVNEKPANTIDSPQKSSSDKKNNMRIFFPEAWLWSIVNISNNGEEILEMNTPHSITSWDANVFCVNDEFGFGMSDPSSLVTFLPFFLMVNVPKTVIRTETVFVNVSIYNYLGHSLPVKISFETSDGLKIISHHEVTDCISELSPASFNFTLAANSLGLCNVTATALVLPALDNCSPAVYQGVSDTVMKSIKVLAEGYQITNSHSALFCANENLKSPWNVSLPNNIIQNSAKAKLTVSPGLLGPALQGLGDFLEIPTGCGEQNMIRLAPNIHILRYLDAANIPNSDKLKEKAKNNIKKGYQRQLQYRHLDGSYSAFGPKNLLENEEASIWLTAFVISSFGQASNIIMIDNATLNETLHWIVSKQSENGCFPMIGQVYSRELRGGLEETESTAALTAYIVSALYKSRLLIPASVAFNAEFCLSAEHTGNDVYSLSLITYAFTILNSTSYKAQHSLLKLLNMAKRDQDFIWWEKPGGSLALSVEMTGYAILSLLKIGGSNNVVTAQAAVRWISTKRNYKGGFISTQDTVIGLEAVTEFSIAFPSSRVTSLLVRVTENEHYRSDVKHTFMIENNNRVVQQYVYLKNLPSVVNVQTRGVGCALIQVTSKYNVDEFIGGNGFDLSAYTAPISYVDECYFQNLEVCVTYKLPNAVSNMVIIVINFISGYFPDRYSLTQMVGVERWEEDEEENKLIVYLQKVESTVKCFNFVLQRLFSVSNLAPAIITVTDYYHPEYSNSTNYTIVCNEAPMLMDSPYEFSSQRNFENFKNVDFDLEVPEGIEGPEPSYSCPDNNRKCQYPKDPSSTISSYTLSNAVN